jgi:hypothetical protein
MGRKRKRDLRIGPTEEVSLLGESIYRRCRAGAISVAAKVIGAQSVYGYQDEVWLVTRDLTTDQGSGARAADKDKERCTHPCASFRHRNLPNHVRLAIRLTQTQRPYSQSRRQDNSPAVMSRDSPYSGSDGPGAKPAPSGCSSGLFAGASPDGVFSKASTARRFSRS